MTKKEFIKGLNKYLREKSIYKEKELIDYQVFGNGQIKLYYKVNMVIDKKMILTIEDLGINSRAVNVHEKLQGDRFKFLIENGF